MLEDVKREDPIENVVAKRQVMRIAHDVGVLENLVLELDAIRIAHGPARADVEDKIPAVAQDGFKLRADWIAVMVGGSKLDRFRQKNRHAILERERVGALSTRYLVAFLFQRAVAFGTDENLFEARA